MKKLSFIGIAATFAAITLFTQCSSKNEESPCQAAAPAVCQSSTGAPSIKIAYVDIDSLFTNYKLSVTMNKEMLRKEENMRMTLTERAKAIQADYEDFQRKLENNVYSSRQRAEEEQNRIIKSQEEYSRYEQRLISELTAETQKNNSILRDSINSFLKAYNSIKGFDLIISRVGDNLLYANSALDITQEVIDGLNNRYAGSK